MTQAFGVDGNLQVINDINHLELIDPYIAAMETLIISEMKS